jgi:hypothetical protein
MKLNLNFLIIFFIYDLFNDVFNSSDYKALNVRICE